MPKLHGARTARNRPRPGTSPRATAFALGLVVLLGACIGRPGGWDASNPEGGGGAPALPVPPPPNKPANPTQNPFLGATLFVNPEYGERVQRSMQAHPELAAQMEKVRHQPTALWVDRIAAIERIPGWLAAASAQQKQSGKPVVPVLVVYDLPNRDCSAKASAGELKVAEGGEERYRKEFIDPIARHFAAHPELNIVAILEPDSLPNVISNLSVPACAEAQNVYKHSIAYAVSQLSRPNVHLYLDTAHGGWLGWDSNRRRAAYLYKEVLELAGGHERIRGFATNISNYNVTTGSDGKRMDATNPCPNEQAFVRRLDESLREAGIVDKGYIIDTSRNGQGGIRTVWGHWCNIRGAGLGERPRAAPTGLIDAYYWVKPPGDSDGTSATQSPRFDHGCATPTAMPEAPEAGEWFDAHFAELVKHANPPL